MTNLITPLIMSGGAGTRLCRHRAKIGRAVPCADGTRSTFQDTVLRVSDPALFGRPIVITNGGYRFLVAEQLAAIGIEADVCWSRHGVIPVRRLPRAQRSPMPAMATLW